MDRELSVLCLWLIKNKHYRWRFLGGWVSFDSSIHRPETSSIEKSRTAHGHLENQSLHSREETKPMYYILSFFFFFQVHSEFIFKLLCFYFTILYWFCHTSTWICHRCTCVPNPEPPSHLPPHTIPLGHPSAPAPSILYPASNLDWRMLSFKPAFSLSSFNFIMRLFNSSSLSAIRMVSSAYLSYWYFSWQSWFQFVHTSDMMM